MGTHIHHLLVLRAHVCVVCMRVGVSLFVSQRVVRVSVHVARGSVYVCVRVFNCFLLLL
jgi:hypothetical protein